MGLTEIGAYHNPREILRKLNPAVLYRAQRQLSHLEEPVLQAAEGLNGVIMTDCDGCMFDNVSGRINTMNAALKKDGFPPFTFTSAELMAAEQSISRLLPLISQGERLDILQQYYRAMNEMEKSGNLHIDYPFIDDSIPEVFRILLQQHKVGPVLCATGRPQELESATAGLLSQKLRDLHAPTVVAFPTYPLTGDTQFSDDIVKKSDDLTYLWKQAMALGLYEMTNRKRGVQPPVRVLAIDNEAEAVRQMNQIHPDIIAVPPYWPDIPNVVAQLFV